MANENITLGGRPEDIWLEDSNEEFPIEVTVSSIEPLGGYTIVNVDLDDQIIKVRAPGQVMLSEGFKKRVRFDKRRIHLFCRERRTNVRMTLLRNTCKLNEFSFQLFPARS